MWYLKRKDGDTLFYIKSIGEFVVGRNFGDLTFPNDKSISRKHATIHANGENIFVEDHNSKYGTYVNEGIPLQQKMDPNIQVPLHGKDNIRFGLLGNEWTVCQQDFVTCVSTMKEEDIKLQLEELNIEVCKDWKEKCTHLTMPSIILTLKVVIALVQQKPIVKPEFWNECLRCRNNNLMLPNPEDYLPNIKETSISQKASFHINIQRKSVFSGKNFIFFSRQQLQNYQQIIQGAGGTCSYLGSARLTNSQLCLPQNIVVQFPAIANTQESQVLQGKVDNIVKYIELKKKRVIPEKEIGLAILYVSIEKYCNPEFSFASIITNISDDPTTSAAPQPQVLAPETQDLTSISLTAPSKRIEETLNSSTSSKHDASLNVTPDDNSSHVNSDDNVTVTKRKAPPCKDTDEVSNKKIKMTSNEDTTKNSRSEDCSFNFINENSSKNMTRSSGNTEFTIQIGKRKRKNSLSDCQDEDLFNFVPDAAVEQDKKRANIVMSNQNIISEDTSLKLGRSSKRKHDGTDTPDGKRFGSIVDDSVFKRPESVMSDKRSYSAKILQLNDSDWFCKKRFSKSNLTIKNEKDEDENLGDIDIKLENELMTKLKELDLRPAIVVVNNDLIRSVNISVNETTSSTVASDDGKKNFKKFVKVRPQRVNHPIVSSNMLKIYEPKAPNAGLDKFAEAGASSDEEGDSFLSLGKTKKTNKERSRRL